MPVSIRLEPAIEERLNRLAAKTGRSKSFYLRQMIEQGLEDLEDYYLAEQVMRRVRAGKEKIYTLEEVERNLGLAD
jgi:RHH-type rel operon transcriptional repressor/antitoxin RelB